MASASGEGSRKAQPWTDEAKYQLLLRIVAQLREGGKPIDWKKINMPGRTPKSLQNTWFQIKKSFDEFEKKEGGDGDGNENGSSAKGATPRKKTTGKGKAMALQDDEDDEDDEDEDMLKKKATPRKRNAESLAGGKAKQLKCEPKDDAELDEDDEIYELGLKAEKEAWDSYDEM